MAALKTSTGAIVAALLFALSMPTNASPQARHLKLRDYGDTYASEPAAYPTVPGQGPNTATFSTSCTKDKKPSSTLTSSTLASLISSNSQCAATTTTVTSTVDSSGGPMPTATVTSTVAGSADPASTVTVTASGSMDPASTVTVTATGSAGPTSTVTVTANNTMTPSPIPASTITVTANNTMKASPGPVSTVTVIANNTMMPSPARASTITVIANNTVSPSAAPASTVTQTTTIDGPTSPPMTVTVTANNTAAPSTATVTASPSTVTITASASTVTQTTIVAPPPTTVTVTTTATPSPTSSAAPAPTPDSSCSNPGIEWAYYPNGPGGSRSNAESSSFDPTYFKTVKPTVSGNTTQAGGLSGTCTTSSPKSSIYGNSEPCSDFTLNYRGYLYSSNSGDFTFNITRADNIVYVWGGDDAYSGYTGGNAILHTTYSTLPSKGLAATVPVTAGEYVPIRIMFAQGSGPYGFAVTVTAPDGSIVLNASSGENPDLVRFSCDGTEAPAYPAYGSET